MERGRLGSELRESVALLRTETWLFGGGGLAWATYAGWVVATGLLLQQVGAGLADTVFTTLDGVAVSLFAVIAVGLWLVVPALSAVVVVNRRLRNDYGNLTDPYRLDHPSLLLSVPGTVLLGCLLLGAAVGPHPLLTGATVVASVHLVVRTVAYGHRVYTLSVPVLLSLFVFLTTCSLGAGWLVWSATGPPWLSAWAAQAGVTAVVETGLRLAAVSAPQVVTGALAVPGVLATAYLLAQLAAGAVVRARAPLANPERRPDQRFPIMPPVGGPRTDDQTTVVASEAESPDTDQSADDASARQAPPDSGTADLQREHTGTRVFSPDEVAQSDPPAHESTRADAGPPDDDGQSDDAGSSDAAAESQTPVENDAEDPAEEWVDDTAVFSPGSRDAAPSYCGECGESLSPGDSTCPSCGESVER